MFEEVSAQPSLATEQAGGLETAECSKEERPEVGREGGREERKDTVT